MRIVFDLDGTLCTGHPYEYAIPIPGAVHLLGDLRVAGHTIIIQTARGMGRTGGAVGQAVQKIGKLTLDQLEDWGFVYDEIYFGKPSGDLYVDDAGKIIKFPKIENFRIIRSFLFLPII